MKKSISVLLALILALIGLPVVSASASDVCDCGFSPIIYVGPLGCTPIVRDAGKENEQNLWKADTSFLLKNLTRRLPDISRALLSGNDQLLGDAIVGFVNDSFGDLALDNDGKSKSNVTTPQLNAPQGNRHGLDCDYYFDYDFRLDPYEHAERLHAFIGQVKELTGHDSVKLKCSSMGGVVLSAYLDKYGSDGINVIICRCCPLWGTAVAGEAFTGKLEINPTALRRYGEDAIPYLETGFADSFIEGTLYSLLQALRVTGVLDGICSLGDKLIEELGERIYNEALIPVFGTLPGIWAFVPQNYFEEATEFMRLPEEGGLRDKIFAYRDAMLSIAANLKTARENGTEICLICGYNVQRTPLVTLWKSTSDGTVDTEYASLGAICGEVKNELPAEYVNSLADKTYLSPDNMIDASTCELRECTWFVRNWLHCNGNSGIDGLFELVMTNKKVSVRSFQNYPQFLLADDDADTVVPVTSPLTDKDLYRTFPSYMNFVRMIFEFISKIFSVLFV